MVLNDPNHLLARIAGFTSIVAGFLHVTVVSVQHWAQFPPLESGFFITAGFAQVVVGILFLPHPSIWIYRIGLFLNGGLAFLYVLIGFLPAPFVGEPEAFSTLGLSIAALEVVAVGISLAWLLSHIEHSKNTSFLWATSSATAVILVGGFGFYGGAQAMELVFPERVVSHDHGDHEMNMQHMDMQEHVPHQDMQLQDSQGQSHDEHDSPAHPH